MIGSLYVRGHVILCHVIPTPGNITYVCLKISRDKAIISVIEQQIEINNFSANSPFSSFSFFRRANQKYKPCRDLSHKI